MSSNINNGNKNPFRSANDRLPNIPKTVGNNYGDRMKYQKVNNPNRTSAPASRPVDQFDKGKNVDASNFAANAKYRNGRRTSSGAPYKPALLHSFENGMVPKINKKAGQPSDDALVNFLDKVITYKKTIRA